MENMLVYPAGTTMACQYAAGFLRNRGIPLVDHPTPEVTHLLLDAPSFDADGTLRGGGSLQKILQMLPQRLVVAGGNLNHPDLEGYKTLDLLQDTAYLAVNAAITADCALRVAEKKLETTFADSPVLITGWGRIGKCLGQLLKNMGVTVTIAARKESDRAMAQALGFGAVDISETPAILPNCRLLFNTVPELVIHKEDLKLCKKCIKIDLASRYGIEGDDVIIARGLPGIYAPESSGKLICETFLRLCKEEVK